MNEIKIQTVGIYLYKSWKCWHFQAGPYLGICEVVVQRELQFTQLFLFFFLFLPFLLHLSLLQYKKKAHLIFILKTHNFNLTENTAIRYLLSSLSFAFLFLSAATCLPLPHFLWLFLFAKAFLENAEDEACHQNQNHHDNGSYCPHGNCKIKRRVHYRRMLIMKESWKCLIPLCYLHT